MFYEKRGKFIREKRCLFYGKITVANNKTRMRGQETAYFAQFFNNGGREGLCINGHDDKNTENENIMRRFVNIFRGNTYNDG